MRRQLGPILSLGNAVARTSALLALTDRLNPADFPALMAALLEFGVQGAGDERRLLLSAWAGLDASAALAWETAHPDTSRDPIVLEIWSRRDPGGAIEWLETHGTNPDATLDLIGKALKTWAVTDPRAAFAWAESHPGSDGRNLPLQFVIGGLAGSGLDLVGEVLPRLPEEIRGFLPQLLGESLARAEPAERERCLKALPDSLRSATVANAISFMRDAPMAAKLDLLRQYPEAATEIVPGPFYQSWVQEDAEAALAELRRMPAGERRGAAIFGAVEGLSRYGGDAHAALQLINDYPEDAGEKALAHWIMCAGANHHEYLLAIDQIPRLSTPQAREQGLKETLESWFFNDAPTARQWMNTHEVPSAVAKAFENY